MDETTTTVLRLEVIKAPEHKPGVFPVWLREQGADVVIVGGIGQRALSIFAHHGIRVVAGQPNASPESMVKAYLAGKLVESPIECGHHDHHGDEHGHSHGHEHGSAHCDQTPA